MYSIQTYFIQRCIYAFIYIHIYCKKLCISLQNMEELFADKPWVQPLTVAGSHLKDHEENEKKENTRNM